MQEIVFPVRAIHAVSWREVHGRESGISQRLFLKLHFFFIPFGSNFYVSHMYTKTQTETSEANISFVREVEKEAQ